MTKIFFIVAIAAICITTNCGIATAQTPSPATPGGIVQVGATDNIVWRTAKPRGTGFGPRANVELAVARPVDPDNTFLLAPGFGRTLLGGGDASDLEETSGTIAQGFSSPWNGKLSANGLWRINGLWTGTGGNILDPAMAQLSPSFGNLNNGYLMLSVAPNQKRGSELQTLRGFNYGYYETSMQVTSVPGVCASFFWIEAPNYGPHEWDVEFLTNESWITSANQGAVHLTLHPSNTTFVLQLPFNPSKAFHRYGFLWTPGTIVFTVDGVAAHSFSEPDLTTTAKGFIMANMWTGNPNWGGGPPTQKATTVYDWMRFTAGATGILQP